MNKYRILLMGAALSIFLTSCGTRQTKEAAADTTEITQLSELTEELTLNDSDENIQIFTMKIGNDPQKSRLKIFPN